MHHPKKIRFFPKLFVLVLCVGNVFSVCVAQDTLHIHGIIVDHSHQPVDRVNLTLYNLDSSAVREMLNDPNGHFLFTGLKPGRYFLHARKKGYLPYQSTTLNAIGKVCRLDTIPLLSISDTLEAVTISTHERLMQAKNGRITYNVSQSPSAAGSSAFDILQRLPGVRLDQNENIQLNGSAGVATYIDGKKTYLSSKQLNSLLRGMDAGNIRKMEIMQSPSAEYDAAGTAGIINIVTRKQNRVGYAMDASTSIGFGHYDFNRQNLTGNVHLGKWNIFAMLDHNYTTQMWLRKSNNLPRDGSTHYNRLIHEPHISHYYTYKVGLDWSASAKDQLGIRYMGSLDNWKKDARGTTKLYDQADKMLSYVENRSVAVEPYRTNTYNFNYIRKLDSTGKKISFDYDYTTFRNNSDGYLSNTMFNPDGSNSGAEQDLKFHQPNHIHIHSAKADIELPMRAFTLKSGVKYAAVSINNRYNYDSLVNGSYQPATSLSDDFSYKEKISAIYASASKTWSNLDAEIGLRMEHTYSLASLKDKGSSVKRDYTNLFPSISLNRSIGTDGALSLTASRRINRPSYQDLNPVRYYSDKYSYYSGNPDLRPELSWTLSLAYVYQNSYMASLSYSRTTDFVGQTAEEEGNGDNAVMVFKNANFKRKNRIALLLSAPFTIFGFWEINTNFTPSYTKYPLIQSYGLKDISIWSVDGSLTQTFKLPSDQTLELVVAYTSPELNGVYRTPHYFSIDGGYKKSVWKKRMDIALSFTDILHTIRLGGTSQSDLMQYSYVTTRDSRRIALTVTYHLGGNKSRMRTRKTEEQLRL